MAEALRVYFDDIDGLKSTNFWMFFDYILFEQEQLCLCRAGNDNYFKLFNPEKFNAIIDSTVEQAKVVLAKLKE